MVYTQHECQRQFNSEFNYSIYLDLPVPTSIFHSDSTITLLFCTQQYVQEKDNPEWKRNFSSVYVAYYEQWFGRDIYQIEFETKTGRSTTVCQTVPPGNKSKYNIAVICKIPSKIQMK